MSSSATEREGSRQLLNTAGWGEDFPNPQHGVGGNSSTSQVAYFPCQAT